MKFPGYSKLNNLGGIFVFIIASITYLSTREQTVSWWDCGEFLSASYKLEVVHEPGSPLFLMIGRFFSLLTTNPGKVASAINASSALASAACIMLLFWSITSLTSRILPVNDKNNLIVVLGSGLVGSLAYCFSDTFWFSAVESEVYALSSLCTALVIWAILKWESRIKTNDINASRWLIFIAYIMGLSIGVHLLNLLSIPALTFVYYFHFYKPSWKGVLITFFISIALLIGILYGIIPLTIDYAAKFDIFAVNQLHWSFNSGATLFFLLLAASLSALLVISRRQNWPAVHNMSLAIVFILIGYSSYAMVIIRARADTPLNNSNPSNFISLLGYLGREQYQESPLISGQNFTADVIKVDQGEMRFRKGPSKYDSIGPKPIYVYDPAESTLFPRMWDNDHASEYRSWTGLGQKDKPTFIDNINFFFSYQLNYMYWRYFMWNFAGRQNDTPSTYPNPTKGNWLSGISFIDSLFLGNQSAVPDRLENNKANNPLYFLPFLLGICGLGFQLKKDVKGFTVVMLLFLFTGIAIAVYLNMPPSQPRERDYAFAGSFYAFALWIGIGVSAVFHFLKSLFHPNTEQKNIQTTADLHDSGNKIKSSQNHLAFLTIVLCLLLVPVLMASREWDDHDRSNRFTARDFAANYLRSCAANAILFTYGDNETYPLWYAQEVEGIRTDIRVINLSLFDASWCIDKAAKPMNRSAALPISWKHEQYVDGVRDYLSYHNAGIKGNIELQDALDFMGSNSQSVKNEEGENYLPSKKFKLTVNSHEALETQTIPLALKDSISQAMEWNFNHNTITKGQIIILDILAHNHWKRPIYFCSTMGSDSYMGIGAYLKQEGIVYRLLPLKQAKQKRNEYPLDEAKMYHNLMEVYRWGNINKGIHIDDQTNSFAESFKDLFVSLAAELYKNGKKDSCLKVLDRCMVSIPELPPLGNEITEEDFSDIRIADMYLGLGETKKGNTLIDHQIKNARQYLDFANSQGNDRAQRLYGEVIKDATSILDEMLTVSKKYKQEHLVKRLEREIEISDQRFSN